ncbi:MPN domain-containing protein [Sphingomonas antarctica]|uniref:RadC family protein n=1 Tax=Sphingomonas antarctica TaxID=2040274 RepID=UPI0039EC36D1
MAEISHDAGHRERLRERLLSDHRELLDHEIVEYLLMLAIPRIDTKPIAKDLLAEFGGIGALLAADPQSLMRVKGMGDRSAAAIRIVQAAAERILRGAVVDRPVLSSWQALLDYLRATLAHRATEQFWVLHLDGKNVLIRDEMMSEGTVDQAAVHVREVIRRALELASTSIILVHNHPSGDPQPSQADIRLTRTITEVARNLGIAVHDHVIIGANGHSSMRALGLI